MTARVFSPLLILTLAAIALAAPPAGAAPPAERALYEDAPSGLHLLEKGWSTRSDPGDVGLERRWARPGGARGFRPVQVPHAFNARDRSSQGFRSRVQWYRLRFDLPEGRGATGWKLRFESVNREATVHLNGRRIGRHEGAHVPFEVAARGLRPRGNELVVRVDGRLAADDLPPGDRPRGWWNYGGLLREVYLRRVTQLDLADLRVEAEPGAPAQVRLSAVVRNTTARALPVRYGLEVDGPGVALRAERDEGSIPPGALRAISSTFTVAEPSLWTPDTPVLYRARVALPGGQVTATSFGIRSFRVDGEGRVLLNGRPISLRGASFHEETPAAGGALGPADRNELVAELRRAGADFTRQHYPPHPALLEAFDRAGIVFWEQIPVWRVRDRQLRRAGTRREALRRLRRAVLRDRNHASVMTWSVANETLRGGAGERRYLAEARRLLGRLDGSRLLAVDKSLRPLDDIPDFYRDLDAIGLNEYIGWYGSSTVGELPGDLAAVRARFPRSALFVTEFGAEASREGSASDKGTFAFQRRFLAEQLDVIDQTPFLNGALVWLLRDFTVRPGWAGGNPRPDPPLLHKGLFDERGRAKPALDLVAERFDRVPALAGP